MPRKNVVNADQSSEDAIPSDFHQDSEKISVTQASNELQQNGLEHTSNGPSSDLGKNVIESTDLNPDEVSEELDENSRNDDTNEAVPDTQELQDPYGWVDIIGSRDLMKRVLRKGEGSDSRPTRTNVVTINVKGKLEDGKEVDCLDRVPVTVGDAEVVQGLDLALPLMELNEMAEIIVKPRFAYGKLGKLPDIPPDTTITYTVELLQIEQEPEFENLSVGDRMAIGNRKRETGNFWYSRGDFNQAVHCYRRALDFLDDTSANFTDVSEELQKLLECRLKVYNNMAAAQLKMEAYDVALKSAEHVLKVQPQNVKALFRKGKILAAIGKTEEALLYMRSALKLAPEMKVIHQELSQLLAKQRSEVTEERELYKRMFGHNKTTIPSEKSKSYVKWVLFFGGITVAVLSAVVYRHL